MRKHTYLMSAACMAAIASVSAAMGSGPERLVGVQREIVESVFPAAASSEGGTFKSTQRLPRAEAPVFGTDWALHFNTPAEFDWCTVIDANGDAGSGYSGDATNAWSWRSDSKCAQYQCWSTATDDWLVLPGLRLKGGKQYKLRFLTTVRSDNFPAEMTVAYGTAPKADSMTNVLIPVNTTTGMGYQADSVSFSPRADGIYYIGFHLTKVNYMLSFYLDDVEVTGTPLPQSPAAVTALDVVPDPQGRPRADVRFTLPTARTDGSPLPALSGVRILCDDFVVADLHDVRPGQAVSWPTGDLDSAAWRTYTVVPYNDVDQGAGVSRTAYIGLDVPATPSGFRLIDNTGYITARWDAPRAEHSGVFFPERVTHTLYDIARDEYNYEVVGEAVDSVTGATELRIATPTEVGEQHLKDYLLNARNAAGQSPNYYRCYPILLGKPYPAPFHENFDNNGVSDQFWMSGGSARIYSIKGGFDSRPGCVALNARNLNDTVFLFSGKISLAGAASPRLAFRMGDYATAGTFRVFVRVPCSEGYRDIQLDSVALANARTWSSRFYDLARFASERFIQVGFTMATHKRGSYNNYLYLDHITVGDMPAVDLAPELTAPRHLEKGRTASLTLRINNYGTQPVQSFRVRLADGETLVADTLVNRVIGALDSLTMTLPYTSSLLSNATRAHLAVTVTADGDTATGNNSSAADINLRNPAKAPTTGLTGSARTDGNTSTVSLYWDAAPKRVPKTDDFESYSPWLTDSFGNWTTKDIDGGICWGFNDDIVYGSERYPFAYTVFNPYNYDGYGQSMFSFFSEETVAGFVPRSGDQYLAAVYSGEAVYDPSTGMYVRTITDADNWLVSPQQDGRAQTISFYVNNFAGPAGNGSIIDHKETFEVLVSATDTARASFRRLGGPLQATGGKWTEVRSELPEGTRYFAIRHCSKYDQASGTPFIFMVDDVSVEADNDSVAAYRVYRDGRLLAQVPGTAYTDGTASGATDYLYQVTVVYADGGESSPVSLELRTPGSVRDVVSLQAPADIFATDGCLVRRAATTLDGLQPGVYIVNGKKVLIK